MCCFADLMRAGSVPAARVLLVLGGLLACARAPEPVRADPACEPVPYALAADVSAASLAGTFAVTLVATSGDSTGRRASGRLTLRPTARSDAALVGTGEVAIESVGARRVGALDARGDSAPGVAVFARSGDRPSIVLRLGSEANAVGVVRFDGEYTALTVHRVAADGFSGSWRSGDLTERAAGHFCARRGSL
jgi:hypothetical protein